MANTLYPSFSPYGSSVINPYNYAASSYNNPDMAMMMMQQQMQMQQTQTLMLGMNTLAKSTSEFINAIASLAGGGGGSSSEASSRNTAANEQWGQCPGCKNCS